MGMVLTIVLMNYQRATVGNQMHVMGGAGAKLIPTLLGAKRLVISAIYRRGSTSLECGMKIISLPTGFKQNQYLTILFLRNGF